MAASLQAAAHMFFQQMRYEFSLDDCDRLTGPSLTSTINLTGLTHTTPLKMAWLSFGQDATNGRDKYSTMLVDAAFVNVALPGSDSDSMHSSSSQFDHRCQRRDTRVRWLDIATKISRTSDILPIEDETGRGCFAFSDKAFRSIGCPTPADFHLENKRKQEHDGYLILIIIRFSIYIWSFVVV